MKNKILKLMLIFVVSATTYSCEEEASDTTPPAPISHVQITEQENSVLIEWIDPTDSDFEKVMITYTNEIEYELEVLPGVQQVLIEGLTNLQSYSFTVTAVDKSGNESIKAQLTATPELKVYHITGYDIENGIYTDSQFGIVTSYEFSGTNSLNVSVQAAAISFYWEGTWSEYWNGIRTELKNTSTQETELDFVVGACCFEIDEDKYYYHGAFSQVHSDITEFDRLPGEYILRITNNVGELVVIKKIVIDLDSTYEYYEDDVLIESGTITDENIRNRDFVMIFYPNTGQIYLYFDKSFVLKKQ